MRPTRKDLEASNIRLLNAERLVHELRVHQIELEQQNEELQRLRDEVEAGLARYMDLYDSAPIGYLTVSSTGEILELNRAAANLFKCDRKQVIGSRLLQFIDPPERRDFAAFIARVFESVTQQMGLATLADPDRTTVHVEAASLADHASCRVVMLDISEQVRAEAEREHLAAQLRESQKMEALGTLAGGIAHDFNNILGTIIGNSLLGRESVEPEHPAQVCFAEIDKASARAKSLVEQILAFSRHRPSTFIVQPIAPIVREVARLARVGAPANVALEIAVPDDSIHLNADLVQIQQVLLILLANAIDAMPAAGGKIAIEARACLRDSSSPDSLAALAHGNYVCITVSDSGQGMTAEVLERVFEPFFTTKALDKGTGLGLSVAHGIVQNHGGAIQVESEVGRGTRFKLWLPATAQASSTNRTAVAAATADTGGGARILYVDDDDAMVFMVKRLLERRGYRVSGYQDPREAIAAVKDDPGAFDAVVTDFNMPGPSGLDVARELMQIRGNLPVVITSGYVTKELQQSAEALGVHHVIYKPNTVTELCEQLHLILGGTQIH